jgi:hypothetical protein
MGLFLPELAVENPGRPAEAAERSESRLDRATPAFYGLDLAISRASMILGIRSSSKPTLLALAAIPALCGCAVVQGPDAVTRAGLTCVDDSAECISRRQATLRHLVDDQGRTWVKEPATPEAYASGVRLFAFKAKKKELSCDELAHGRKEAEAARAALKGAATTLTPSQVARGTMLATEVAKELQGEMSRRCKKT